MKKYFIWTIGCQMNKAESSRIEDLFINSGYKPSPSIKNTDIILINTCVVRQSAEDKVIGMLNYLKGMHAINSDLKILVTGCFVDSNASVLYKKYPHVSGFFKAGDYNSISAWFKSEITELPETDIETNITGCCAIVPINQGCNNFCSYCIVPYRRGREISRPPDNIINEIRKIALLQIKEVTLVGQNVNSYGHDLENGWSLSRLLKEINDIEGLERIRFLTNHPKDMEIELINTISELNKVCKQINLPLQAGNNRVLEAMNRGYTREHYFKLIDSIKARIPDISLSTDIIVGFPGETREEFEDTLDALRQIRFDVVHAAMYSTRTGTPAAKKYIDDITPERKKERLFEIEKLQTDIAFEINSGLTGSTLEILIEGKKKNKWFGRTRSNKLVFIKSEKDIINKTVYAEITSATAWSLQADLK